MKEGTSIVQERVLPARPETVYAAFGDAESLAVWMCPGDVERSRVEVDFRVGGRFTIEMQGTEQTYPHSGEFIELDPPKRLVFTWRSEWLPEDVRTTHVSVELEPSGDDATHIRLVHTELPADDTYDGHDQGWSDILAALAAHLDESARSPGRGERR